MNTNAFVWGCCSTATVINRDAFLSLVLLVLFVFLQLLAFLLFAFIGCRVGCTAFDVEVLESCSITAGSVALEKWVETALLSSCAFSFDPIVTDGCIRLAAR